MKGFSHMKLTLLTVKTCLLTAITCLLTAMPCYAKGTGNIKTTHKAGQRYGNKINEGSYVLKYNVKRFPAFKPTTSKKGN